MSQSKPKKSRFWWLATPFLALLLVAKFANSNPPTNQAKTGDESDLRAPTYDLSLEKTRSAAILAAKSLKTYGRAWKIADEGATLRVEVPVTIFTDDLSVSFEENDGKTRVEVESKARIGRGDFGENRRHIRQFLAALDAQIKGSGSE